MMRKLSPRKFIEEYMPYALQTEDKFGIDAKFILAQAVLESGWGERAIGNMFFGIKASKNTPEDKRQLLKTREVLSSPDVQYPHIYSVTKRADGKYEYRVKDWFRKYDTPEESFSDHAKFFFANKRYTKALEVKHEPYRFAEEIAKAGYATDPNYAIVLKLVIGTIEKNM